MNATDTPDNLISPTGEFSFAAGPSPVGKPDGPKPITLTVVYNNIAGDPALKTSWGFAVWIEEAEGAVLFDTGSNGDILLGNITASGLDLTRLHSIVISHEHWDHVNGLPVILSKLKRQISVFVPSGIESQVSALIPGADVIAVTRPPVHYGRDLDHRSAPGYASWQTPGGAVAAGEPERKILPGYRMLTPRD